MFDPRFNNYQNTVQDQSTTINPYEDQYFGQYDKTPYREANSIPMPQPMAGDLTENSLYPLESSLVSPGLNVPISGNGNTPGYAQGGMVKNNKSKKEKNNPYPSLAEMIRKQGQGEDTILAHINPLEAMMLQQMGGSGTINPVTGLPQFGFFNKPWKAMKSILGGAGGAILGNMILPGVGGVIGGALGQAGQNAIRGKSVGAGALKGALGGAMLPGAASALGAGASGLGMNSTGNFLSNYGNQNALLPSLSFAQSSGGISTGDKAVSNNPLISNMMANSGADNAVSENLSFMDKLTGNTGNFLSNPKNLLSLATIAGSFMNRPKEKKEKTPEQIANEEKRYRNASRLSPAEIEAEAAAEFLKKQANYRLRHNLAAGEGLAASPVYRKVKSPEEYRKTNKWLEYYDNPNFSGKPILMKKGGIIPKIDFEEEEIEYPSRIGYYLKGQTGGQDDEVPAEIPDGGYVIPADVVSHAGDGNSEAGALKFDALLRNIPKPKGKSVNLPPKGKSLASYMMKVPAKVSHGEYVIPPYAVSHAGNGSNEAGALKFDALLRNIRKAKGGSIHLPPKAKSLASYMMR